MLFNNIRFNASAGDVFTDEDAADTNSIMLSPAVLKLFGVADDEVEAFIGQQVTFRLLVPADDGTDNVNEIIIDKQYTFLHVPPLHPRPPAGRTALPYRIYRCTVITCNRSD